MGSPGMRYSLVSREVIADSIETVVGAEGFDGVVAIGGCDKNIPGLRDGDRASSIVRRCSSTAAPIRPGLKRRDIVSVFEAVGGHAAGRVSDEELLEVERTAIPGPAAAAACTPRTRWPRPSKRSAVAA
jgi:dihydroxy-acid dehydratase